MEGIATALRALHITAGVLALATFWIPLVVAKGARVHRKVGRVYVLAMFVAALTAGAIAPVRMAQQPMERWGAPIFLAYVALLSFTAAFHGLRAVDHGFQGDVARQRRAIAPPAGLLLATVALVAYALASGFRLALFFAPLGVLVGVTQLRALRSPPASRATWIQRHIGAMVVSCIATLTAFLVTNARHFLHEGGNPIVWLAPAVLGAPLISWWQRRYRPRDAEASTSQH